MRHPSAIHIIQDAQNDVFLRLRKTRQNTLNKSKRLFIDRTASKCPDIQSKQCNCFMILKRKPPELLLILLIRSERVDVIPSSARADIITTQFLQRSLPKRNLSTSSHPSLLRPRQFLTPLPEIQLPISKMSYETYTRSA